MSVSVSLLCNLKAGIFKQLKPFLEENLPNVRSFSGCLNVTVLYNTETNEMLLSEEWLSPEHHQEYMGFIANNGILNTLASYLEGAPDIKYFERIEI